MLWVVNCIEYYIVPYSFLYCFYPNLCVLSLVQGNQGVVVQNYTTWLVNVSLKFQTFKISEICQYFLLKKM